MTTFQATATASLFAGMSLVFGMAVESDMIAGIACIACIILIAIQAFCMIWDIQ